MKKRLNVRVLAFIISMAMLVPSLVPATVVAQDYDNYVTKEVQEQTQPDETSEIGLEDTADEIIESQETNAALVEAMEDGASEALSEDDSVSADLKEETKEEILLGDSSSIHIEINQGLSKYAKIAEAGDDEYYLNDFVANKATVIMFEVPGATGTMEPTVSDYKLEVFATKDDGTDGDSKMTIDGSKLKAMRPYDNNGVADNKWMAVFTEENGNVIKFEAGK